MKIKAALTQELKIFLKLIPESLSEEATDLAAHNIKYELVLWGSCPVGLWDSIFSMKNIFGPKILLRNQEGKGYALSSHVNMTAKTDIHWDEALST